VTNLGVYCRALVAEHYTLRASALLALTKLMALDAAFCDTNLQLLFTLLQNKQASLPQYPSNSCFSQFSNIEQPA
jgi:hypothetical protein